MNDNTRPDPANGPADPPRDVPVGAPLLDVGAALTCTRELFALSDEFGRTWIAVGSRKLLFPGGVMSHLLPGETATVVSSDADGVVVRFPRTGTQEFDRDLPAYLLPAPLLPTFDTAATPGTADA